MRISIILILIFLSCTKSDSNKQIIHDCKDCRVAFEYTYFSICINKKAPVWFDPNEADRVNKGWIYGNIGSLCDTYLKDLEGTISNYQKQKCDNDSTILFESRNT